MKVLVALVLSASMAAVAAAQAPKNYTPPKTAWGDPDLQGLWPGTAMVGVPFERPAQFGNRLYLTEQEFKQRQKDAEKLEALDNESFSVDNVKPEIQAPSDRCERSEDVGEALDRAFPLRREPDCKIFEYACHEGNHAMSNVLLASRSDDRNQTGLRARTTSSPPTARR